MNDHRSINERRLSASLASGGISADPIYETFIKILVDLDLKGDLMDFGSGTGNLIKLIHKLQRFSTITGADLMSRPPGLDSEIGWKTCDLNETQDVDAESYDVIVSSEVIEHLENPRHIVREWFRLLRPGGHLVFSTPNNESWRSLASVIFRGHFAAFSDACYPAHITALLHKDIERILIEAGFERPFFEYTDSGGIPKFPHITWQSVSVGLLRGLGFSDNLVSISKKPQQKRLVSEYIQHP